MNRVLAETTNPQIKEKNPKPSSGPPMPAERLFDLAAATDEHEALRQAEADIASGRTIQAREAFATIRKKFSIGSH